MGLCPLLCYSFRNIFRVPTFELSCLQIPEPSFHNWNNSSQEKQPDSPPGRPEPTAGPFAYWPGIESIVYHMLQVFAHPNLPHKFIFVSVHACDITNMCKDVLKSICQLESIHRTPTVLHMTIHNEFCQPHNFSAEMKRVTKPRLLSFFGGQSLYWL